LNLVWDSFDEKIPRYCTINGKFEKQKRPEVWPGRIRVRSAVEQWLIMLIPGDIE
jgi:hypothetical protein